MGGHEGGGQGCVMGEWLQPGLVLAPPGPPDAHLRARATAAHGQQRDLAAGVRPSA